MLGKNWNDSAKDWQTVGIDQKKSEKSTKLNQKNGGLEFFFPH